MLKNRSIYEPAIKLGGTAGGLLSLRASRIADSFIENVFVNGRVHNLLELDTVLKSIRQGTAGPGFV